MQYGGHLATFDGKQSTELSTGFVDKETQSRTLGPQTVRHQLKLVAAP
jgi:hypothetical protein